TVRVVVHVVRPDEFIGRVKVALGPDLLVEDLKESTKEGLVILTSHEYVSCWRGAPESGRPWLTCSRCPKAAGIRPGRERTRMPLARSLSPSCPLVSGRRA